MMKHGTPLSIQSTINIYRFSLGFFGAVRDLQLREICLSLERAAWKEEIIYCWMVFLIGKWLQRRGCLHSLVVSWFVPNGVTLGILSQGGSTRSPFSARPWTRGKVSSSFLQILEVRRGAHACSITLNARLEAELGFALFSNCMLRTLSNKGRKYL